MQVVKRHPQQDFSRPLRGFVSHCDIPSPFDLPSPLDFPAPRGVLAPRSPVEKAALLAWLWLAGCPPPLKRWPFSMGFQTRTKRYPVSKNTMHWQEINRLSELMATWVDTTTLNASPHFIPPSVIYTQSAVCLLYLSPPSVHILYRVRSPQSAVRSPQSAVHSLFFILTYPTMPTWPMSSSERRKFYAWFVISW